MKNSKEEMKKFDEKMEKVMGIIKDAGYGCRDIGHPILFFTVYVREALASLQTMSGKQADDFIVAYGVYDVHDLNGKPVWVEDDGQTMRNLEPCIIN